MSQLAATCIHIVKIIYFSYFKLNLNEMIDRVLLYNLSTSAFPSYDNATRIDLYFFLIAVEQVLALKIP